MKYSVSWKPAAEADLAQIWLAYEDRTAITRAANELEKQLMRDPFSAGESREGADRITFVLPLVVEFRVYPADLRVDVLRIRLFLPPSQRNSGSSP